MIYLDNAATTKCAPEAVEVMLPYLGEKYGNASSIYALGSESRKAVSNARRIIAESLNCTPQEIYFTTGGSEADNWALIATAEANEKKGKHIITTAIEHHAILHTCDYLAGRGFEITYLPVDEDGIISLEELKKAIRPDPSSRSKRWERLRRNIIFCSIRMPCRPTDIFRLMLRTCTLTF